MDREVIVGKYIERVKRMCLEGRPAAQERAVVEALLEAQGKPAVEWPEPRPKPVKPEKRGKRGSPKPSPAVMPTATKAEYKEHEAVLVAALYGHQKGTGEIDAERVNKMLAVLVAGGDLTGDDQAFVRKLAQDDAAINADMVALGMVPALKAEAKDPTADGLAKAMVEEVERKPEWPQAKVPGASQSYAPLEVKLKKKRKGKK